MKYLFYLKSHSAMPDIEEEIEAKNIVEAVKFLCERVSPYYCDYSTEDLFRNMGCLEKDKPKPSEDKIIAELLLEIRKQKESKGKMEKEKNDKNELILKLQKFFADKGLFEEVIDYLNKEKEKDIPVIPD